MAFPRDRRAFKFIVYIVYILEVVQMIVLFRDAFECFGSGFGNFEAINRMPLTGLLIPILGGTGMYAC